MLGLDSAFGLDPFGPEIAAVCAVAALVLVAGLAAGFGLLWRATRPTHAQRAALPRELGLVALWRLGRTAPTMPDSPAHGQWSAHPHPPPDAHPHREARAPHPHLETAPS